MNKKYTFKTSKRLFKIVTILMIKNKISNVINYFIKNFKFIILTKLLLKRHIESLEKLYDLE